LIVLSLFDDTLPPTFPPPPILSEMQQREITETSANVVVVAARPSAYVPAAPARTNEAAQTEPVNRDIISLQSSDSLGLTDPLLKSVHNNSSVAKISRITCLMSNFALFILQRFLWPFEPAFGTWNVTYDWRIGSR
jgi:hypothetical protein